MRSQQCAVDRCTYVVKVMVRLDYGKWAKVCHRCAIDLALNHGAEAVPHVPTVTRIVKGS